MSFEFDDFQVRGCEALEDGHGVLVCAPTGAGKTIVGEFAVHLALAEGRKCFYTTPIKALSNQKYGDLVERYGSDIVGLLTGDTSINGGAQIVVMTTEVLRNMLYAESTTLDDLGYVVLDEVHYLADRFRGAVWEEVILHLPDYVRVVGLSVTPPSSWTSTGPCRCGSTCWSVDACTTCSSWSAPTPVKPSSTPACCERSRRPGGCTFPRDCGAAAGVAPPSGDRAIDLRHARRSSIGSIGPDCYPRSCSSSPARAATRP